MLKSKLDRLTEIGARLDAIQGKAVAATDDAARTAAQAEFAAADKEFAAAKADYEGAKALLDAQTARRTFLANAARDAAAVAPGVIPPPDHAVVTADAGKAEDDLCLHFAAHLAGKALPDRAREALTPRSSWQNARGLAMPMALARRILPEVFGKALPITTLTATGTQAEEFKKNFLLYEPDAATFFPRTQIVPAVAGKASWPRVTQTSAQHGGVVATWTAEGVEKTDTEPTIAQLEIQAYELSAYTEMSRALVSRSPADVMELVRSLFRAALLYTLDTALINGNGSSKPTGILQTTSIGTLARATASQVSYDDLVGLLMALPTSCQANAVYLVSPTALAYILKLKDDQKAPLLVRDAALAPAGSILGRPVVQSANCSALGTKGDVICCDPKQYVTAVEQEIVVASSDQYKFKSGCIAMAIWMQVGGKVAAQPAFVALDDAA